MSSSPSTEQRIATAISTTVVIAWMILCFCDPPPLLPMPLPRSSLTSSMVPHPVGQKGRGILSQNVKRLHKLGQNPPSLLSHVEAA